MTFDLAQHQRDRIRALERDNRHLDAVRCRLERLLAIALKVAAGDDCDPVILIAVLEELDRKRGTPIHELAQLLRETNPDRRKAA